MSFNSSDISELSIGKSNLDFKKASQAPMTRYSAAISMSFFKTVSKNNKYCSAKGKIDSFVKSIL